MIINFNNGVTCNIHTIVLIVILIMLFVIAIYSLRIIFYTQKRKYDTIVEFIKLNKREEISYSEILNQLKRIVSDFNVNEKHKSKIIDCALEFIKRKFE